MQEVTQKNFGLLIAYILPGFIALSGLSYVSPVIRLWLSVPYAATDQIPTVAGFLYVTMASVAMGMAVSAIRWAVIDRLNHITGISRPQWDDSKLQANLSAYQTLIAIHYNYYQFYANTIVAMLVAYAARRSVLPLSTFPDWSEPILFVLIVVFAAMARDTLKNYYSRATILLGQPNKK